VQDAGVLRAADGDVRIREVRPSDLDPSLALRRDAGTMRDLGGPQPADPSVRA
jgi:hypothetical protein